MRVSLTMRLASSSIKTHLVLPLHRLTPAAPSRNQQQKPSSSSRLLKHRDDRQTRSDATIPRTRQQQQQLNALCSASGHHPPSGHATLSTLPADDARCPISWRNRQPTSRKKSHAEKHRQQRSSPSPITRAKSGARDGVASRIWKRPRDTDRDAALRISRVNPGTRFNRAWAAYPDIWRI